MCEPRRAAVSILLLAAVAAGCGSSHDSPPPPREGVIVYPMEAKTDSGYTLAPQLFRMKPDGSGVQQLTYPSVDDVLPTDANDFPVLWPDGQSILFASGREKPWDRNPMHRMMYRMALDGTGVRRVTTNPIESCDEWPNDVSPDGAWIAFDMACDFTDNTGRLFLVRADGTEQKEILPAFLKLLGSSTGQGVFTPDGEAVLFLAGNFYTELWRYDLRLGHPIQLTNLAAEGRTLRWRRPMISPRGDMVYFSTMKVDFSGGRMEAMNIDGTGRHALFDFELDSESFAFVDDRFALSPAGDRFVFSTLDRDPPPENLDPNYPDTPLYMIVTSALDGTDRKVIYRSTEMAGWGDPAWR